MAENPDNGDVSIRIDLEGSVDSDTVYKSAADLIHALRDIEENITHAASKIHWRWSDDAFVVASASPNGVRVDVLKAVVKEARLGFERVKEASGKPIDWPRTFGPPAKKAVKRFVKRLATKETLDLEKPPEGRLEAIEVHVQTPEPIQPLLIDHVMFTEELGRGETRKERASVDGILDLISVRGGAVKFEITEHSTERKISCSITESMLKIAKKALGRRVVAEGTLHFRSDGSPRQLSEITEIWTRPNALPITKLRGSVPNLTGGVSAEDYVRRIRGRPRSE